MSKTKQKSDMKSRENKSNDLEVRHPRVDRSQVGAGLDLAEVIELRSTRYGF
jgi:hypothetical protein